MSSDFPVNDKKIFFFHCLLASKQTGTAAGHAVTYFCKSRPMT